MKERDPEDRGKLELEIERILESISSGAIEDLDELSPEDLALLIEREGSLEEVELLFDRLAGPEER